MKDIITVSFDAVYTYDLNKKTKYKNSNKSLFKKTGSCYYFLCFRN